MQILQAALAQVYRRTEQIRQDDTVGSNGVWDETMPARKHSIHHWQGLNPVTTEALIMLTMGAPQLLCEHPSLCVRSACLLPPCSSATTRLCLGSNLGSDLVLVLPQIMAACCWHRCGTLMRAQGDQGFHHIPQRW